VLEVAAVETFFIEKERAVWTGDRRPSGPPPASGSAPWACRAGERTLGLKSLVGRTGRRSSRRRYRACIRRLR
jgi:hypothetical protein